MVRWLKRLFGYKRYFIFVYMYQTPEGVTGQGQCTVTTPGSYVSIDKLKEDLDFKTSQLIPLNIMELNFRDFRFYIENSRKTVEENGKKL